MIGLLSLGSSFFYAKAAIFGLRNKHTGEVYESDVGFDIFFFVIFCMAMVKSFITDFRDDSHPLPIKDFIKIATRYFKTNFMLDLVVLIPFHWFFGEFIRESNYLFLIKSLRILRGLDLLSVSKLKEIAKAYFKRRTEKMIEQDRSIGDDKIKEHNNIETVI